jgi:hypothetical protein
MTESMWLTTNSPASMLAWLGIHYQAGITGTDRDGHTYAHCGVSEHKLRSFVLACREVEESVIGKTGWYDPKLVGDPEELAECVKNWASGTNRQSTVPMQLRAAIIRDLVGNPWRPVQFRCQDGQWAQYVRTVEQQGPYRHTDSRIEYDVWQRIDWLTPTVVAMARGIDEERAFERMPVLADFLEESGCMDEAILDHLRAMVPCPICFGVGEDERQPPWNRRCSACNGKGEVPAQHWRGCHILDMLTNKE